MQKPLQLAQKWPESLQIEFFGRPRVSARQNKMLRRSGVADFTAVRANLGPTLEIRPFSPKNPLKPADTECWKIESGGAEDAPNRSKTPPGLSFSPPRTILHKAGPSSQYSQKSRFCVFAPYLAHPEFQIFAHVDKLSEKTV